MTKEMIAAMAFFTKYELGLTDEEWAQTKVSYDPKTDSITFDFGEGLEKSNPERATALRQWVLGIPDA
jgi:hypothetical protein